MKPNCIAVAVVASLLWGGGHVGAVPAEDIPAQAAINELRAGTGAADAPGEAWIKLGNALMQDNRDTGSHDFSGAKEAFRAALRTAPGNIDALVGMAWVCNSEHDFSAGAEWAGKVLAIDPVHPEAHALLSDRAIELGDYESAFEHLQSALDARADLSTYSRASHLLWLTGDLRKARWLMDQAIASGGGYPENTAWCRAELAVMELHAGAMIVAEQHAARALREAPANPRVLATMGKVRACQGRLDEAVALYRRSIASAPTHDALAALADLYLRQGRAADAEKAIQAVIDHHGAGGHSHGPGGATHHHATGNAQLARFLADHDRNLEQALREAQAAGKTSRSISCMDTLAWCYLKTGEIEMAVRTIRRALKWKTPDPHLYFHAGLIHEAAGNHQLARRHLDRAFALNPRFDPLRSPAALVVLNAPRNAGPRPSGITPR